MNRHSRRFIDLREFKNHAKSLNVKRLKDDELKFYEKHCLLLPAVVRHQPTAHLVAVTQKSRCWTVENPEDLERPEALRRLQRPHVDGLHSFDAELGHNSLLLTPDCTTFEPWAGDRLTLTAPNGRTVQLRTVERFYSPWQVHVVELLRQRMYYYAHSRFLKHIDPSHDLWNWNRLPEHTEPIRSLRGMADGFEALERFLFADRVALEEAFDGVDDVTLPEPVQQRLDTTVTTWARQSLEKSGLEQPAFFRFLHELVRLIDNYRRDDERISLAEDTEAYLLDAQRLAGYAFEYDWDDFLEAAEEHVGPGLSTQLRWLDPVEAAVRDAKANLKVVLGQDPVSAIANQYGDTGAIPDEIVQFCLRHDLLEVLYGLQCLSYSAADLRRDRFPGFAHRRLRMLALSGEQLARGVLEARVERGQEASENHHKAGYRKLVETLGRDLSWLAPFRDLKTSDKQGNLDQRAVRLAEAAYAVGAKRDDVIANALAAAVATRNLVSHRHRLLSSSDAGTLAGPCADAVVLIWLTAREKGLV